jgi:hypothetical protein
MVKGLGKKMQLVVVVGMETYNIASLSLNCGVILVNGTKFEI